MKFLHTSDWHIGKSLKGRSRLEEQEAVLKEIVALASEHEVDAVLIAGDLYDASAPSADAQRILIKTLLGLADTGAQVIAMAGNHDSAGMIDAYRPLAGHAGITLVGQPRPAARGGVVTVTAASTGETLNVAVLPFLSQRWAVRASEMLTQTPAEAAGNYDQQIRELVAHLKTGFTSDAVNVVMAHLTVSGGVLGGGERAAQTIFEYWVPAAAFGSEPHYVALGHLHRRQSLRAGCPVHYSGSPICVDFGEEDNSPVVVLVEATPTTPARTTDLPLESGRRLRTVRGTVAELADQAAQVGDAYLRVYVNEPTRAGLREEVLDALPNALEIRIVPQHVSTTAGRSTVAADRTPGELFAAYCSERDVDDARVRALFDELHDALTSSDAPPDVSDTTTGVGAGSAGVGA
ncbi:exodeoxyribonuclease I subunit D [Kribbella orskensis]|uniref:Nuclease SbcCD subunit D n=1 Tax=Kribbella orskensis TaxID=2512216 RepID=A0ABY2BBR9_9ACTN|nr:MULTISPECIES: exonuclease SbcCD subunit D [Kribbella]TCN32802.1 exodeoxyribonuclease I subunit D [Kribbella sp. VKM Ac-2500]TCO12880.1 exodeoxyribonuclease I subunit D [Kribbella orskensis]